MKKEFIVSVSGNSFVTYEGLLAEAHEQGLCRISTTLVQIPNADNGNVAIVMAEVETGKGTFCGIGDASAANVGRMIAPHIIRMAETRAKARAMRDAVNIGMTAVEELGDSRDTEPTRGDNVREFNDTRETTEQPPRASNYTPTGVHNPRPARQDFPKASPDKPASANQLATIAKLSRLIGKPEDPREDMSSAEAADRITDLSREYNERRGSPVPSQRGAQAQERAGGATEAQLKAIWAMSRKAGTPEDPKPGDYTRQLASARIEELTSILDQGGQQ